MNYFKNRTYRLVTIEVIILSFLNVFVVSTFSLDVSPRVLVNIFTFFGNVSFWFGIPIAILYPIVYFIRRLKEKKNLDAESFGALYKIPIRPILITSFSLLIISYVVVLLLI